MGGLRPKLPVTYATFLIGSLALAAIFPFAGFWSKDEILAGAYLKAVADPGPALLADHGARIFWLYYAAGLVVSVLTAFYTFRMVLLTFHGQPRDVALHTHAHEAPVVMAAPLGALAVGALGAGAILGVPPENGLLHRFLEEVPGVLHLAGAGDPPTAVLAAISMAVALTGIALAYVAYQRRMDLAGRARRLLPGAQTFLEKKWYMDHLGDGLLVLLAKGAAYAAWGFDAKVVDGLVNLAGTLTRQLSGQLRRAQTGRLQNYALLVVVGLVLTVGGLMVFR